MILPFALLTSTPREILVGLETGTSGSDAPISLPKPSGVQEGDLLIYQVSWQPPGSTAPNEPPGFSSLAVFPSGSLGQGGAGRVSAKIAGPSEPSSYQGYTNGPANDEAVLIALRGSSSSAIIGSVADEVIGGSGGNSFDVSGITAGSAGVHFVFMLIGGLDGKSYSLSSFFVQKARVSSGGSFDRSTIALAAIPSAAGAKPDLTVAIDSPNSNTRCRAVQIFFPVI